MRIKYQVLTLSILIITCFFSCKEEDSCEPKALDHELSFLVGKWEWVYSEERVRDPYTNYYNKDTVNASDFSETYSLLIYEFGLIQCYKGNTLVKSFNFCEVNSYDKSCYANFDGVQFHLYEKGASSHSITGCGSSVSNIMGAYTSNFIPLESNLEKQDTIYQDFFIKVG